MRRQSGNRPGPYDKKDRGGPRGGNGGRNDFGTGGRGIRGGSGGPRGKKIMKDFLKNTTCLNLIYFLISN